jgi:hypothetical protein
MMKLDLDQASLFARIALAHVRREYPNKLDHVLQEAADALPPRVLHPVFYGSYDWHSCVHGYWLLLRLLRTFPQIPEAAAIRSLADEMLVPEKVAGELAYLQRPSSLGFERPYGWAWLLKLHAESASHGNQRWASALQPMADLLAVRFRNYLPKLTYPIRTGTHLNTAFAIVLALDWADRFDASLAASLRERAVAWFGNDRDAQAWEPCGDDFHSSVLVVALCMQRAVPETRFRGWFHALLPRLATGEPATLFKPATVSDRTDGKIAHLDGLNLSRAWCWRALVSSVEDRSLQALLEQAADRHLEASLPHVKGDYMGEHWLATYALLALQGDLASG